MINTVSLALGWIDVRYSTINQSINQSINPPLDQPTNRPTNQPTNQPTKRPTLSAPYDLVNKFTSQKNDFSLTILQYVKALEVQVQEEVQVHAAVT